jgi:IS30 family transposase
MAHHAQLTISQRYQIQTLRQTRITQKAIASQLGVSPATISRELARNRPLDSTQGYQAQDAQQQACQRRKRTPYKLKGPLLDRVKADLRQKWSPEQISGRLEAEQGNPSVSHETIYQMIYSQPPGHEHFMKYLRIRHKKRYKKRGQPPKKGGIPNRVSIEARPPIVETNTEVGHWEGDTIIGFDHDGVLLTLVERVTKFTLVAKLPTRKADPLAEVAVARLSQCSLPVKSLTLDNGLEFASHQQITAQIGIAVFFAHPYHSWERGLNENTNGLIRQYIPKGQRIGPLSAEFVSSIETELNHRPRKALGFLSPFQYAEKQQIAFQT